MGWAESCNFGGWRFAWGNLVRAGFQDWGGENDANYANDSNNANKRELGRLAAFVAGSPVMVPVMFIAAVRGRLGGRGPRDGVRELWDLCDFCDMHYSAERDAELERRLEELEGLDEREGRSAGSRELERRLEDLEELEELEDLAELEGRGAGWSERGWR